MKGAKEKLLQVQGPREDAHQGAYHHNQAVAKLQVRFDLGAIKYFIREYGGRIMYFIRENTAWICMFAGMYQKT